VSAVVQRRLGAALDAAGRATGAPRALVGLAHGSRHELGILAFAVVLQRAGLDVAYLGADVPPESWVAATRSHRPAVVVLGAPTRSDVVPVRETVAALAASCPETPVYVGGSAQDEVGGASRPLGHSIRRAVEDLSAAVAGR
jgi:methanogenic corrinoid protein MtbC1